jgi:SAM-dependent methyltransferase
MSREQMLREEFNRWAAQGRGESMERHHLPITEKALRKMDLQPGDRVLDLGCGEGWASRIMARLVGDHSQVVGLDISDEMIRRARERSRDFDNLMFVWGSAGHIPWEENFFTKVLSVESFYYCESQERVLAELFRVMAPLGELFLLMCIYKGHPAAERWARELSVPVHLHTPAEYVALLQTQGWLAVEAEEFKPGEREGETPDPHGYALLVSARKPDIVAPPRGVEVWA